MIADEFERQQRLARSTRFDDDLAFDSAELMELLLLVESLAGVELSETVLAEISEVGELYDYYVLIVSRAEGNPP